MLCLPSLGKSLQDAVAHYSYFLHQSVLVWLDQDSTRIQGLGHPLTMAGMHNRSNRMSSQFECELVPKNYNQLKRQ